ncbi:MAG: MFS transporter, partial [Bacteroidetes bacterium]|nr:MFS transporter [Bacteroidota bacterium]
PRGEAANETAADAGATGAHAAPGSAAPETAAPETATTPAAASGGAWSVLLGSLVVFFLYTGLEVVAGQWSYTLFTVGRDVDAGRAGPWISVYWGSLTVGRVAFGWIAERIPAETLLRATSVLAILGVTLLWVGHPPVLGAVGLGVLGFCLAPMFPLLIGETPRRVGTARSDHMVGLQIASSNIGAVSLVGLVGLLVEVFGLEIIGPALFVNAVLFLVANEFVAHRSSANSHDSA